MVSLASKPIKTKYEKDVFILKRLFKHFLKGVLVTAPVAITIFVIYKIVVLTDNLFINLLKPLNLYFPGVGIILTFVLITLIGILASNWLTGKIFNIVDGLFRKVPFIKSIYTALKDTLMSFFDGKKGFSKLAIINLPNSEIKLLGFVTNENLEKFELVDYISVYLMQSMQWAGNLILVPKDWVTILNVSAEDAIKFIASAGLIDTQKSGEKFK